MPWSSESFNRKHAGGKLGKRAAQAGAEAANAALEGCLKKGKSRYFCEGYAIRTGISVANKVKEE